MAIQKMSSATKSKLNSGTAKKAAEKKQSKVSAAEARKHAAFIKKHKLTHMSMGNYCVGRYVKGKTKAAWKISLGDNGKYTYTEVKGKATGAAGAKKVNPKVATAKTALLNARTANTKARDLAMGKIKAVSAGIKGAVEKLNIAAKAKLAKAKTPAEKKKIRAERMKAVAALRAGARKAKLAHRMDVYKTRVALYKARIAYAKAAGKATDKIKMPVKPTLAVRAKTAAAPAAAPATPAKRTRKVAAAPAAAPAATRTRRTSNSRR